MRPIKTKAPKTEKTTVYARSQTHKNNIEERMCAVSRKFVVVINPDMFVRDN